MRRQALIVLGVTALAGCGAHHRAAAPPPSPAALLHDTIAAAADSPGARYDLELTSSVELLPGAKSAELHALAAHPPRFGASGAIGKDVFTATTHGAFPFPAQAIVAGPTWAYLRFKGQWYGSSRYGLSYVWPRARAELAARGGPAALLAGRAVVPGPSGSRRLTGRASRLAVALIDQVLGGFDPTAEREVAHASTVELDVGAADHLPRRLAVDVDLGRVTLVRMARDQTVDTRGIARVRVHVTMTFSDWGHPPSADRPPHARSWEQYLHDSGVGE